MLPSQAPFNERIVIDVRSPSEFEQGHVPSAINIPLFTDPQRAEVGTMYKHTGKAAAVMKGLEIVGPELTRIVGAVRAAKESADSSRPPIVYCFRGGMRSASVAWLLRTAGIECELIEGGYKNYRKWVLGGLSGPWKLVVIGGRTGSGKSKILDVLAGHGHQVLDLEKICNHKGSAFGALSQPPQPTQEHAVNVIHSTLQSLNPEEIIFVEDESKMVGRIALPPELFAVMMASPVVVVDIPRSARAQYLGHDYGEATVTELEDCFLRIAKKLGGDRLAQARLAVAENRLADAADVALDYYDRTYDHGLNLGTKQIVHTVVSPLHDPEAIASEIELVVLNQPELFAVLHK